MSSQIQRRRPSVKWLEEEPVGIGQRRFAPFQRFTSPRETNAATGARGAQQSRLQIPSRMTQQRAPAPAITYNLKVMVSARFSLYEGKITREGVNRLIEIAKQNPGNDGAIVALQGQVSMAGTVKLFQSIGLKSSLQSEGAAIVKVPKFGESVLLLPGMRIEFTVT